MHARQAATLVDALIASGVVHLGRAYLDTLLRQIGEAIAHGGADPVERAVAEAASTRARQPDIQRDAALGDFLRLRRALHAGDESDPIVGDVLHVAAVAFASAREEVLEEVLRQLPVGVSITDAATGRGLFQNEETVRLTQRPVTLRRKLEDYARYGAIHPDGKPYTPAEYPTVRAIQQGEDVRDEEMLYRRDDGDVLTLLLSSRPLRDAAGAIMYALTSVTDVTELAEARRQLRQIADSVPIHLLLIDRDERFLFVNAAAAALWSRAPEEFLGQSIADIIGPESHARLRAYTEQVLAGHVVHYESAFRGPDGTEHTYLNTYSPFRDETGTIRGFVATGTDITQRKLDEQLRERFVAALSHDLRTPLSAARMAADVIVRSADDPGRAVRMAGKVRDNIDRVDEMIRNMLDANVVSAHGALPIDKAPVDLVAVVRTALDDLGTVHGDRFVFHAPPALDGLWDATAVRRVVENLCGNAIKYGAPDRPVTVTLAAGDQDVTLDVHNEGAPIAPGELPHLFEPFRRARGVAASGQLGWGIGLALVRGLVEAHGGTVAVASDVARGTVFRVTLVR